MASTEAPAAPPATPAAAPAPQPDDTSTTAPPCIFCERPAGTVTYVWSDWLCRLVMEQHGDWTRDGEERRIDLVTLGRMEREVDTSVTRVCDTCAHGWIQRLEDHVRPVLESMIAGESTPLPPIRRKLLARWAAKTAVVMECAADDTPIRTPRFAREHLRKVGVHPGTQVLAGRYEGQRQILSHERDLFSTTIDGEKRYASQTSFVIGRLLLQVFAAPWQDTVPELTESAAEPFIPLVGPNNRDVVWPPRVAIDDSHYDLVRRGSDDTTAGPSSDPELPQGRGTTMTTDDIVDTDVAAPDVDETTEEAAGPERAWHSAAVVPDATPDEAPDDAAEIAPEIAPAIAPNRPDAPDPVFEDEAGSDAPPAEAADASARTRRKTSRRRLAGGLLMLVVLGGVLGWGLHQRSEANRLRSHALVLQTRAHTREVQLRNRTLQFRASQATIGQLNRNIAALASDKTNPADRPEQLRQIIAAIPAVSDGVRHCANISLATVSDALDFVATYPQSTTDTINTDSSKVETTCGQATAAINTLEGLTAGANAKS